MTRSPALQPTAVPPLVLASSSPRRRTLLERAGYTFSVEPSGINEPSPEGFENAEAYVTHVAWLKANAIRSRSGRCVLAADTVALLDDEILGKPRDRNDAHRILSRLAGTRHRVLTGLCLLLSKHNVAMVARDVSVVVMKRLSARELTDYLDSGLWEGKAGAYGIQDRDDPFVEAVEGSETNVMGLPMERLAELMTLACRVEP